MKFGNVAGYFKAGVENTWSWNTRSRIWQGKGNYLVINGGGNGNFFSNWFSPLGPWYYSADGGLDLYLRLRIANGYLQGAFSTDQLLYATLRIGFGVPSIMSIECSGTASLFLTYDTETDPHLQRWGLALAIVAQVRQFGFIIPVWAWNGEWSFIEDENDDVDVNLNELVDTAMNRATTGGGEVTLLPRGYLNNWEVGDVYPGIQGTTVNPDSGNPEMPIPLCKDDGGMPSPSPLPPGDIPLPIGTDGNTGGGSWESPPEVPPKKIPTLVDHPVRAPRRRATLVTITDHTNTTFVAEAPVWDDGTPDYSPSTARLTNGCSVVAWMNEKTGLADSVGLSAMMAGMEIAVAVWNDETGEWESQNLTSNNYYDRSPVVKTATNGTAAVAWIRNTQRHYMGSATKGNQVCFSQYANGVWTPERIVASNVGRVRKLDMAYDGNQAAIAYNEEDDPGNGTTQRLYVVTTSNLSTWSRRSVAEFPVNNSVPFAYYDEEGNLRLVWNDGGTIKTARQGARSWSIDTINTDGHAVPGDYVFTRAHSGRMALVWLERLTADDSAMGLVAMTCNPAYNVWSLPRALTSDGKDKAEVSAAFNEAGDLEILYATPIAAPNGQGGGETVSSGFSKVTRTHGSEVAILAEDVSFSTNVFTAGETIGVCFKVKNIGDEPVYSNLYFLVRDLSGERRVILTNAVCVSDLNNYQRFYSYGSVANLQVSSNKPNLEIGQSVLLKVPWKVPEVPTSQIELSFSFGYDINHPERFVTTWRGQSLMDSVLDGADVSLIDSEREGADVAIVQARSVSDGSRRNLRHVSVALENTGNTSLPAGTMVTFRRGDANGTVLATNTVGLVLAGDEGIQTAGFSWDLSSIISTSDVEVVHVTVELPESADIEHRTLETEIPVDVASMVKSPLTAYTLAYDANGGEGIMAEETPFYDEWETLASNAFTRAGYQFEGWALLPTGKVVYADGARHMNIPMFSRDRAKLHAVWSKVEETASTDVPIPFSWLGLYFPEVTNSTDDVTVQMANFETVAIRQTGKYDGNGKAMSVWQDYVAGTDPTNISSVFSAAIEFVGGVPQVTWSPNLNTNGIARIYTIWGKTNMTDGADWESPTNAAHRFFKVTVELP